MKNDTLGLGTPIKNEELKELLKETKETVATVCLHSERKVTTRAHIGAT